MQVLFNSPQTLAEQAWYMIPVLVFLASLVGSTHCLAMCGGIALATRSRNSYLVPYHLGRLMGYLTLGALAGLVGEALLKHNELLSQLSAVLLGGTFIYLGLKIWRGDVLEAAFPPVLMNFVHRTMGKNLKLAKESSLAGVLVGVFSVFLPCGWLYTFILGALATQSPFLGTLFLLSFWLGTVPILSVTPKIGRASCRERV